MKPRTWVGEGMRWYLTRARHPFKNYVVGHYWPWFATPRLWVKYDGDATIGVRIGDYLQQRIFFDGYYEPALVDWLKRCLSEDDVFWDVGANIGAISLVAAKLCRKVVAFEPDLRSIDSLTRNVQINRLGNVEVLPVALGATAGEAILYQSESLNTGMTSLVNRTGAAAGHRAVTVVRADDLVSARPELSPTIMKIDVEGAEHLVLGGARALLASGRLRALVFEAPLDANARPGNYAAADRLTEAGYRIEPFAGSDAHVDDNMYNFLATLDVAI